MRRTKTTDSEIAPTTSFTVFGAPMTAGVNDDSMASAVG
jgi:hypothetical protein